MSTTQLSQEQAIQIADSESWKKLTPRELALFQLGQERLCCNISDFQRGIEDLLGRPVWTHEMANPTNLLLEAFKLREAKDPISSLADAMSERKNSERS